jgi:hypothetical protein
MWLLADIAIGAGLACIQAAALLAGLRMASWLERRRG